ncbi:MAG: hypothetical protein VB861_02555, partial [Planctomycetaceae bacterium]
MLTWPRFAVLNALTLVALAVPACQSDDDSKTPDNSPPATANSDSQARTSAAPRSRTFEFDYGVTVRDVPEGSRLKVWLPVPQTTTHQ